LGKRLSLLGFYNFKNMASRNNNHSADLETGNSIDTLLLDYRNNTLYNRVGTSLNYGHNGINFTFGAAFQSLVLKGACETETSGLERFPPRSYNNFIPYFSSYMQLPKSVSLDLSYSYDIAEPDISYLFPMPNLSNTLYKIEGNPYLTPERFHNAGVRMWYWNSASMVNISFNTDMKFYENQIVYNQITNLTEQGYVTTSTPSNVKGGNSFSSYIWTNFPIVKTVLTMNVSVNGRISNSPVFINTVENITNSKGYGGNIGLNLTIGQKLTFNAGTSISQTFTQYSIQIDRNQSYINYSANINAKWQVFKKTYLEGTYRFSNYTNKKLDFIQDFHILNLSVRQVIGKKNQWELRAAAVDILNQNEYIRNTAAVNYTEYRTAPTLARYFMLTVSYNIKGFEVKNTGNQRTQTRVVRN
ncbi:MAG: outer membrane beta-barrel family protein, partial [Lentimicrobiaceae bacterium]|nr:outer membrane beta-barrel family protein [Lentimicrobiaceae bacterium]